MSLTEIDSNIALVVVDLQESVVGATLADAPEVIDNTVRLADAFRAAGHTIVLVNVTSGPGGRTDVNPAGGVRTISDGTEVIPQLGVADIRITKHSRGAFFETPLADDLAERAITQIFLAGVATGIGVEETGREGFAHGLNVVFVTDAMADRNPVIHRHCVAHVFGRIGQTVTTDELLARIG